MSHSAAHSEDQSFVSLLARRWRTVGVTFLVTAGAAGFALSCLPPRYEATSKLLIMKTEQRMGGVKVVEEVLPELSHTSNPLFTQVELLRVMPVFEEVIRTTGLKGPNGAPLAPQALAQRVKITPIDKTDLIAVSYVSSDPRQAQHVVQAIGETYLKYAEQYRMEGVRDGFKLVDQQLETANKRMLDAENQLLAFKRQSGTVALSEEIQASVASLSALNGEIRDRQIDLARARARATSLKRQLGMSAQQALKAAAIAQSPRIRALQAQLVEAESSPLRAQGLGSDHPEVVALNQRIAQLKQAIADDIRATGGGSGQPLDEVRMGMIRELAAAEVEINANQAALSAAESRRRALVAGQSTLPDQEIQLARLTRETQVASEIYQQLLE
ncbi:MAG: GumC family protein, partial [Candidatus Sericytochromatia bacterium]